MPHNLVIAKPGSMEELGKLAEATATRPGVQAQLFRAEVATRSCWRARSCSRARSQKLSFTAPTKPGVYPYVCTYPGHWMRMHGALYVVDDLDEYLANPEAYLAKHPLQIEDALLKDRRPRTEWKLEDLASEVELIEAGPIVRQRQGDVQGRQLHRLPQAGRAKATSSAPT